MPNSRKSQFNSTTRATIITELYDAFWGAHAHLFLPSPNALGSPLNCLLSEAQKKVGFGGNGRDTDPVVPGRVCGRVFQKGESCYRCK
jgi:E3 ubiquitin-protein ligase UBR1